MATTLPNLGLTGFFALGEDGWDDEMSLNLLKLSVLCQGGVIDKLAALPGAPAAGDVVLLDETNVGHPNEIAVYINSAWVYFVPVEGWFVFNRAAGYFEWFDGIVWAEFVSGGGGGGIGEAPIDGTPYVREDGAWVPESGGSDPEPSWSYGNGFRANVMGITATGGSTNSPYNLLLTGAANQFFWANGSTTKTLQFEFPDPNRVTGIAFLQSGTTANGTWTISGSNDGSTWTDIINDFVLGGAAYTPYPFTGVEIAYIREFANAVQYKYYRVVLNAGQSTSSTPYVRLMLLRCQPI